VPTLENKTMGEFLGQIKSIRCLVKHDEYVNAILEGLPQKYAPVISVIESKFLLLKASLKHLQSLKLWLFFSLMNPEIIGSRRKFSAC